ASWGGLGGVAVVGVGTGGAVPPRRVLAAEGRVAGVRRADVRVVAVERRARRARVALAGLRAVAHVAVAARRAVRNTGERAPRGRVAGVGRARVAVVADERRPRGADARLTGLRTVADVRVG